MNADGIDAVYPATLSTEDVRALAWSKDLGRAAAARLATGAGSSAAERQELRIMVARGAAATRYLVAANLRLVHKCAQYYTAHGAGGLTFEDLVQEGSLGLMRGVDRFDYRRGFRLSTYVVWWIRQAMTRALADHEFPPRTESQPRVRAGGLSRSEGTVRRASTEGGRLRDRALWEVAHGRRTRRDRCAEVCGLRLR